MARPRKNILLEQAAEFVALTAMPGEKAVRVQELAEEYSVTERTVWRYIADVEKKWASEEEERRPQRRAHFRQLLMRNLRVAWADGNSIGGAATLRILQKLDGLEQPAKLEITGKLDIRGMSPAERDAEIQQLLKERAEHLDGRRAPPMIEAVAVEVGE